MPTDAQVLSATEAVLARPEYQPPAEVGAEFWGQLVASLLDFLAWLVDLQATRPGLHALFFASLLLVLGALIAHIVYSIRAAARRSSAVDASQIAPVVRRDYLAEAASLARDERYLEAIQVLVLAALDRSARAGWIALRPELTNRMIRRRLERSELPPELRSEIVPLLEAVERARFREGRADLGLYTAWRSLYDRLDRAAGLL